jgi:hypothetical protein
MKNKEYWCKTSFCVLIIKIAELAPHNNSSFFIHHSSLTKGCQVASFLFSLIVFSVNVAERGKFIVELFFYKKKLLP